MQKEHIIPNTLDEAIDAVIADLPWMDVASITNTGLLANSSSLGTRIRNNWGLWTGSALKKHFEDAYGLGHADDISYVILAGVEARVQKIPFAIDRHVKRCKDRWEKMMIDPLTLKKLEEKVSPDNVEIPA